MGKAWHRILSTVQGVAAPDPREYFGLTALGSILYVFGGVTVTTAPTRTETYLNDMWALDDSQESMWTQLSPTGTPPTPRAYCSMVGSGSKLWVFGGQGSGFGGGADVLLNDLHVLDLVAGTWTALSASGTRPSPRANFAMGYVGGSIYVFSGSATTIAGGTTSGSTGAADMFEYTVSTNTWSEITGVLSGAVPETLWGMGTDVMDDRMYVCGGYGVQGFNSAYMDVFEFTPASRSWAQLDNSMGRQGTPIVRRDIALAGRNGKLFTFGGWRWDSVLTSDVFVFDIASRRWTEVTGAISGTPPAARCGAGLAFVGSRLMLFGGAIGRNLRVPARDLHIMPRPRVLEVCAYLMMRWGANALAMSMVLVLVCWCWRWC